MNTNGTNTVNIISNTNKINVTILYPSDFFDLKTVEPEYKDEYDSTAQFPEFQTVFYDYDRFIKGDTLKLYPVEITPRLCIYRGWMLKPEDYRRLYELLMAQGVQLINNPEEYNNCHLFPNTYSKLKTITPKTIWFPYGSAICWETVSVLFHRFMVKDYVKSVKGLDFPKYFNTPVNTDEMDALIEKFIGLRGNLYTGGIVIKEYMDFKYYGKTTNEYRVFYLNHKVLTISQNSNQKGNVAAVPMDIVQQCTNLDSNFYTVDFAELADNSWIVIETGDGQVSGLSPNQYIFKYYDEMRHIFSK